MSRMTFDDMLQMTTPVITATWAAQMKSIRQRNNRQLRQQPAEDRKGASTNELH